MEAEEYRESTRILGGILDGAAIRHANEQAAIEAAGTKTLERLYQLVRKGYRPDFDMQFAGAVWLHHPSKTFEHNLLFLYPSGLCVKAGGKTDEFRFYRDDDAPFQKFLQSVPQPTFWERTRAGRTIFAVWIIFGSVFIGGGLLGYAALRLFGFE